MPGVPSRPHLWWILLVLAGIVLLAAAEYGARRAISRRWLPTHSARWIWIDNRDEPNVPIAFAMVRDFHLGQVPDRGRLLIRADEEYQIKLNGVPVGANRYVDGSPIDAYDVTRLLQKGSNRIRADLRSGRGVGGFLFSLEMEGPDRVRRVVSDSGWRVYRRQIRDLGKRKKLPAGESPRVWAAPPTGRWGLTFETVDRPLFQSLLEGRKPLGARRCRVGRESGEWLPVLPVDRRSPPLDSRVTFDFGKLVLGYLAIHLPEDEPPLGLIFTGTELPLATGDRPADAFLIAMPGTRIWGDTTPRLFRYVTVAATAPITGASVYLSEAEPSMALMRLPGSDTGVFGLEMGPLRTPLENELRSELQRLAGVAGGQVP